MPYTYYIVGTFAAFLGLYTVLTYIDVSGTNIGLDPEFSFYLVSIANGASLLGRLGAGLIMDYFGALNTLIPFTLVAGVLTYAWPYASTKGELVIIGIFYG